MPLRVFSKEITLVGELGLQYVSRIQHGQTIVRYTYVRIFSPRTT
jgi:hypothetical protein